ncbi:MAG: M16 family metallopeptidase [Armatimonadota bacterium]
MIKREVLPNGIRVVTETVPYVQSISTGIWITSGARDENPSEMGISHFLEHMMFKGTKTRSAKQIADEFDWIGGQVNAFTDKEYTCYYGKVLSEHLPVAMGVLSDMFLNSVMDPKEIELEKNVILEEIKRHEDTPDDQVHDIFLQTIWNNHPLGKSIIGTSETVSSLNRDRFMSFINTRYKPDSLIIAAAGNLVHEDIVNRVEELFGGLKGSKTKTEESVPQFSYNSKYMNKDTEQVHFCIGTHGYSQIDKDRFALAIIDTTLGGGMSSRLFQEIREKRGLAYSIGSYSSAFREGGYFTVYGGTSLENIEEILDLTRVEFNDIKTNNIKEDELTRSKNQIRGALVLSQESMSSRMIRIAKSEIYHGRIVPLEEIISSVVKVTHDDISRVAQNIFNEESLPIVAIGPFDERKVQSE